MIALFRFWPDVLEAVTAAYQQGDRQRPTNSQAMGAVLTVAGAFDLAALVVGESPNDSGGSVALTIAWAIGRGRFGQDREGWWCEKTIDPGQRATPVFDAMPGNIGVGLIRARDGWVMMGAPNREAFRAISMTFLRKHFYFEHDENSAWRSAAVNELATLVVGTHRAEDVEGTSETYGIPCRCLRDWLDEEQAGTEGALEATHSSLLAGLLHYGSVVAEGERGPGESGEAQLRRRVREVANGEIVVAPLVRKS